MGNHFVQNAKTLFRTPGMAGCYMRWLICRLLRLDGPVVRTVSGGELSIWENFGDYWWGRRLVGIDEGEVALMRRLVSEAAGRPVVGIDVGAHVGIFSIDMSRIGFASVHAFEANPRTFATALEHLRRSRVRNVQMVCAAVGQGYGMVKFVVDGGTGANHVDVSGTESDSQRIAVPAISLDSYCKENGLDAVDLVKIDVEGYEPWVLGGMTRLLHEGRIKSIIIEICPQTLERTNCTVQDIVRPLDECGYELRELTSDGQPGRVLSVARLAAVRQLDPPFINVLGVKKSPA